MTKNANAKLAVLYRLLTVAALVLIAASMFAPIWWVSLKAPQYPDTAFPQGIRIHFHVDGVFNGCRKIEVAEKHEEEALNCKHEMDAINHFVGMYPIAAGGPVERALSPFLYSLLGVMLVGFMISNRNVRAGVMAVGCIMIAAWMTAAFQTQGGVNYLTPNYISDMSGTMDLDPVDYEDWTVFQSIEEGYGEALGRYFRERGVIAERVEMMLTAAHIAFWAVLAAMAGLVVGAWLFPFVYWLLALIPALLPAFFVAEYAGWLWWFGHRLHDMAAFTIKPFMPTVLGQGKVAQFSTFSYPHYGFGLMCAAAVCLLLALLLRRKQLRSAG